MNAPSKISTALPPFLTGPLSRKRRLTVWIAAAVFTLLAVHWSERNGRLAQDSTYDDVGYMTDAAERLRTLDADGLSALAGSLVHNPPHSAFSTLLALVSFEVLGLHDWAPYVFNGFALAAYLFFCARVFGRLPTFAFGCLLLFCLTIPLAFRAVHDFRPDFASAVATAAFAYFGFAAVLSDENHEEGNATRAGIFLGAALWIKPPVFPHTVAVALVVGACIAGSVFLPAFRARGLRRGLLLAMRFGVIGILVALPYYSANGRQTFDYFRQNTGGANAHIWNFQGSSWSILRAFTYDGAEALFIGRYLWVLLACIAAVLGWALVTRRHGVAWLVGGLLGTGAVSLAIFVAGRHNSEYFGLYYQLLLLASALTAINALIREVPRAVILAPGLLLLGLTPLISTPHMPFWHRAPEADPVHGWNAKIVSALAADLGVTPGGEAPSTPVAVFVGCTGFVSSDSMRWICVKDRLPFGFSDLLASDDPAAQLRAARGADYVVAATPSAKAVFRSLPSAETFPTVLKTLLDDPNFREMKVSAAANPPYRLFRNVAQADRLTLRGVLDIPWPVTGFLPVEGPYPQWQLPKVRWGLLPGSTVSVTAARAEIAKLKFLASAPPGASVRIKVNGELASEHVQKTGEAEFTELSLPLRPGENIVSLDYSVPRVEPTLGTRAFLFRDFELDTPP